jgi:hypothetical protein
LKSVFSLRRFKMCKTQRLQQPTTFCSLLCHAMSKSLFGTNILLPFELVITSHSINQFNTFIITYCWSFKKVSCVYLFIYISNLNNTIIIIFTYAVSIHIHIYCINTAEIVHPVWVLMHSPFLVRILLYAQRPTKAL